MLLGNPYAIDLGNGFTKRASKKNKSLEADVITELSVLAPVDDYYNEASFTKIELTNTDFPYYIGEEARKSKLPLRIFSSRVIEAFIVSEAKNFR